MKTIYLMALLAALTLTSAEARAALYKWTDDNGTKHFSTDPSKVPAKYREKDYVPGKDAPSPGAGSQAQSSAVSPFSTVGMTPEKVYRAYDVALKTGKFKEAREYLAKEHLARISADWSGDLDEAFEAMRSVQPQKIVGVMSEDVGDTRATIALNTLSGSYESWADIVFIMDNGWKILKETWHGN